MINADLYLSLIVCTSIKHLQNEGLYGECGMGAFLIRQFIRYLKKEMKTSHNCQQGKNKNCGQSFSLAFHTSKSST